MKETTSEKAFPSQQPMPAWKIILLAGLLVGTLDIMAVIIQTLINGRKPLGMLQFIDSGMFGKRSFSGGISFGLYGLFFHYCISLGWTWLFFKVYPALKGLTKYKVLTGICFSLLIWIIMSQVVLPLSNTPPFTFKLKQAVISMLILIVAIGLPLSFMAAKYCGPPSPTLETEHR